MVALATIDQALAELAMVMRAQGAHGIVFLPIFERLERERDTLAGLDERLDRALARVAKAPLSEQPPPPR